MIKWVYYIFRNLVYYRKSRQIDYSTYMQTATYSTLEETKSNLTSAMLATVGLKLVDQDSDTVPWYIPLSKVQKSWIQQVKEYGYKVGLA